MNSTQDNSVGARYGHWTVLGEGERTQDGRGRRRWRVRCDCGAERQVRTDVIVRGKSTSCGCFRWEEWDLAGRTFGLLTVLERVSIRSEARRWRCRCECGTERVIYGTHLTRGKSRSCGCLTTPETPSYRLAHARLVKERGPASAHPCVDCGDPASDWSYDHADPDELTERMTFWGGAPGVVAYSIKAEHYAPRCIPCHRRFDK